MAEPRKRKAGRKPGTASKSARQPDAPADVLKDNPSTSAVFNARPPGPIVPQKGIAGQSLTLLIAIMSFLASLTLGAVTLVDQSARSWQGQISREATIQIRPQDNLDMEAALDAARSLASGFDGVTSARIISPDDSAALLEPWLGTGLELEELPIPRLVIVTIDENDPPDFTAMAAAIANAVPNASLDDHRAWVARLVGMARTTTLIGIAVLILVLSALALTVVFATRGAMAGNHTVIEVLHFVGARAGYIASQFQRRFLMIGLRGAVIGGTLACIAFFATGWWAKRNLASIEGEQIAVLFGNFTISAIAYVGVVLLIVLVGALTAFTTRLTVLSTLREIDEMRADPGYQP